MIGAKVGSYREILGINIHYLKDTKVQIKISSAPRYSNFLKCIKGGLKVEMSNVSVSPEDKTSEFRLKLYKMDVN